MISRIQMGQPDDQPEYWTGTNTGVMALKNYPAGYLYSNNAARTAAQLKSCPYGIVNYPVFKNENTPYKQKNSTAVDLEQDRFMFQMNGRSGTFIIGSDWKVTTIGDSRIKVQTSSSNMTAEGIRTTINKFIITTEDGLRYTFDKKGLTHLTRYKYSYFDETLGEWKPHENVKPQEGEYAVNKFCGHPLAPNERPFTVTTWYLSEIENTNNGAKITFEYEQKIHDVINSKYVSHQRNLNESGKVDGGNKNADRKKHGRRWFGILSDPAEALKYSTSGADLNKLRAGTTSVTYIRSITHTQRLVKINFPNNSYVRLVYQSKARVDLPSDNAIQKVEYWLNGNLLRGYGFNYGYFFKNSIRPYTDAFSTFESKFARLCLLSIQKIGTGEDNAYEPPYKFEYILGQTKGAPENFIPARNSLSQDHWGYYNGPTSGLSQSEDHDFLSDPANQYFKTTLYNYHNPRAPYAQNGLLFRITFPTGGDITYYYKQNTFNSFLTLEKQVGGVSVDYTMMGGSNIYTSYSYTKANGRSSRWGYEEAAYTSLSQNIYDEKWGGKKYKYPGIEYPELGAMSPSSSFNWGSFLVNSAVSFAGQAILSSLLSTSFMMGVNIVMIVAAITVFVINGLKTFEMHRFTMTNSNQALANAVGGYCSRVEVQTNSPTGYNGKTVYEFTDDKDYPLLEPKNEWPYTQKQRMASWAYGLVKRVLVYDKENRIVSEKKNDYQFKKERIADANNINCNCASRSTSSMRSDDWEKITGFNISAGTRNHLTPQIYFSWTGRADLYASNEKSYVDGKLYYNNLSNAIIDPLLLVQKGKILQKDINSVVVQLTKYPQDYNIPGALQTLKTNNAIHTPVATETWLLKWTSSFFPSSFLLDATVTEFKSYVFNGRQEVKPWKTYALKTKTPLPDMAMDKTKLLFDPTKFKVTSELLYDEGGNLVQTLSNNQPTSFVNDYSDRYVVASAVNATADKIAYTSFEANGKGGWNFSTDNVVTGGLTGFKAYQLDASHSLKNAQSLDPLSSSYTVTYWTKAINGMQVNGSIGELLYTTNDGWKLYKHEAANTSNISVTGTGVVDEVRLFPSGALMSTVAYKEGIGKVAECDANNRLLFYEYDALGRLKLIRNQEKNVIKSYEYNYIK